MRTSFHHQPEAQHPKFFSYPQAVGRLPHLSEAKRTLSKPLESLDILPERRWSATKSPHENPNCYLKFIGQMEALFRGRNYASAVCWQTDQLSRCRHGQGRMSTSWSNPDDIYPGVNGRSRKAPSRRYRT
jgi:hypothetical protein